MITSIKKCKNLKQTKYRNVAEMTKVSTVTVDKKEGSDLFQSIFNNWDLGLVSTRLTCSVSFELPWCRLFPFAFGHNNLRMAGCLLKGLLLCATKLNSVVLHCLQENLIDLHYTGSSIVMHANVAYRNLGTAQHIFFRVLKKYWQDQKKKKELRKFNSYKIKFHTYNVFCII